MTRPAPRGDAAGTVAAWLATREPAPPPALAARLRELLGAEALGAADAAVPDVFLRTGGSVLERLLREAATTRESALDLLAADALVTYAFEAAGDAPHGLEARADRAMADIARVPARAVGAAGAA